MSPALKEESSRKRDRSPVDRDDRGLLDSLAVPTPMLCFASVLIPNNVLDVLCIRAVLPRCIGILQCGISLRQNHKIQLTE